MTKAEQAADALTKANAVRSSVRAECDQLAAMPYTAAKRAAAHMIRNPSPPWDSVRVDRVLLAVPRIGPGRVKSILRHAGVMGQPPKLRDMTEARRELVALALLLPVSLNLPPAALPLKVEDQAELVLLRAEVRRLRVENQELGFALDGRAA